MGSDLLDPPHKGTLAGGLAQPIVVHLGRGSAPRRDGQRRGGGSSGRRLPSPEARRAAVGAHLLRGRRSPRAVDRVPDDPGSVAASIKVNRGLEVVGRMGDDAKKAGGVGRRGISAAKEGRHLTRSS